MQTTEEFLNFHKGDAKLDLITDFENFEYLLSQENMKELIRLICYHQKKLIIHAINEKSENIFINEFVEYFIKIIKDAKEIRI